MPLLEHALSGTETMRRQRFQAVFLAGLGEVYVLAGRLRSSRVRRASPSLCP